MSAESPDPSVRRLKVVDLSCVRDDRVLFSDLSFSIEPHQIVLVEGRNGCGKTTLLRTLCGIRPLDEGEVTWCGKPLDRMGPEYHAELAYVGHHDGVKRDLTAQENLQTHLSLGKGSGVEIDDALEQVELAGYEESLAGSLSAGQRRRLALARLLISDSPLWILDEPLTSLDRHGIGVFKDLMRRHSESGGMVILTAHHDLAFEDVDVQRINLSA
jgi:heme exporter protein A